MVSKRRRRKSQWVKREPLLLPSVPNHTWSMDFVMDARVTADGLNAYDCG